MYVIFYGCLVVLVSNCMLVAHAGLSNSVQDTYLEIFRGTNGPGWKNCVTENPCKCRRAACKSKRIKRLRLDANLLVGDFPLEAVRELIVKRTRFIDMRNNPGLRYGSMNCIPINECYMNNVECLFDLPLCPFVAPTKQPTTGTPTYSPTRFPTISPTTPPTTTPTTSPLPSLFKQNALPNFIVMMMDDMGYGDYGFTRGFVQTGNLTQLAHDQHTILFNNMHSASTVCSPSRAGLVTGRNPHRERIDSANGSGKGTFRNKSGRLEFYARFKLDEDRTTLGDLFKSRGYQTGVFGKWHLSTVHNTGRNHAPVRNYGFDKAVCSNKSMVTFAPYCFRYERKNRVCWVNSHANRGDISSEKHEGVSTFYDENGDLLGEDDVNFVPTTTADFIVTNALDFIEGSVNAGDPFFALLLPHVTHTTFMASPESYRGCSDGTYCTPGMGEGRSEYYATVKDLDDAVGKLIRKLELLDVYDNTFLLITSDNGPETRFDGDVKRFTPSIPSKGDAGGVLNEAGEYVQFTGGKRDLYEGGHRVGGILRFPRLINNNQESDVLVSHLDIFPTVAEMIGARVPEQALDGESMVSKLFANSPDEMPQRTKPLIVCAHKRDVKIPCTYLVAYDNFWKLYTHIDGSHKKLFNVRSDPAESTDIADAYPQVVESLLGAVREFDLSLLSDLAAL